MWLTAGFLKQMLLLLGAVALNYWGDTTLGIRGPLDVMGVLLLIHVIPTLAIAFFLFDKENEREIGFVYTYGGPLGMGTFMGSLLASATLPAPEGASFSMYAMTLLTASVYMSYWQSRVMSRGERRNRFRGYQAEIMDLIDLVDLHRYHDQAEEGFTAIMKGNAAMLLEPDGWFANVREKLTQEGVNPKKLDKAARALQHLVNSYESTA